jgi:hypothetical protein
MRTKYKHIEFVKTGKDWWACVTRKHQDFLGNIIWHDPWKKTYVLYAETDSAFSPDCLRDIADFLEQANTERKAAKT